MPTPRKSAGSPRRQPPPAGRGRRPQSERGSNYLAQLDEQDEYYQEEPRQSRKKKNDVVVPMVLGIAAILAVLSAIFIYQKPELWNSDLKAALATVHVSEDRESLMVAIDTLIRYDHRDGMRSATNQFIRIMKANAAKGKSGIEEAEKWKATVGRRIMDFLAFNDPDKKNELQQWMETDQVVWSGDSEEYKKVMESLKEKGWQMAEATTTDSFNTSVKPLIDLAKFKDPNRSLEETQAILKKALHMHFTEIKGYFKDALFYNNADPTIRMKYTINDEKYYFTIFVDFLMDRQGEEWVVKSAALLDPSAEKK